MLKGHFYHQRIRRAVATFGALFNDIYVVRTNSATGETLNQLRVPLSYGPRDKYLERIRQQPDLATDSSTSIKLPRMSFEILAFDYDSQRQVPKTNTFNMQSTDGSGYRTKFNAPVPYNINFQLNIYSKIQDDALQIVEQIIPYFNPQYTLSIKPVPGYDDIIDDTPIILNGISFLDDYEGSVAEVRTIIYTLDFTMKVMFYGPTNSGPIIRTAIATSGFMPDINTTEITVTPDPVDAEPEDDYGFNTSIIDLGE